MNISDFLPFVVNDLPNCPSIIAKQGVLLSATEFCQRTLCWSEFQDPILLVNKTAEYDLEAPADAYVYQVRNVYLGGRELTPVSMAELQDRLPDWNTATGSEPNFYNRISGRSTIRVFPTPVDVQKGAEMLMRVCYTPVFSASTLPDFLFTHYMDPVVAGAKSRLMLSPGTSYSNPELAAVNRTVFENAIVNAVAESLHEGVIGSVTARAIPFM